MRFGSLLLMLIPSVIGTSLMFHGLTADLENVAWLGAIFMVSALLAGLAVYVDYRLDRDIDRWLNLPTDQS